MPSQKQRSKEDTWTTDELSKALNKTGERRHHRDRDEDRKKDRINGDDKRRHREDDSERKHRRRKEEEVDTVKLSEDERDRLREERRLRREGKDGGGTSRDKKSKEIQFKTKSDNKRIELNDMDDESDDRKRRSHHSDRERRHREDDDDREKRRRHKDDDNDERRRKHDEDERDRQRKHRDREDDEVDERERRRQERRREKESKEDEERRRRHEEKKERREKEDREKRREKDRGDRDRSDRHKDRRDKDRETEQEREERHEREREERRREREGGHRDKKEESRRDKGGSQREEESREKHKSSKQKEEEKKQEEEEDEYNYEEDFEDYEEDFEEDEDEEEEVTGQAGASRNIQLSQPKQRNGPSLTQESIHKQQNRDGTRLDYSDSEVNDVLRALDAENERLLNNSSRSPQVSAQYGRGRDRTPDQDDDSDDGYHQSYQPRQDRPRTAINFVSAKQRALSKKTASKTMQRGNDLLKMLELDFNSFDLLDLPPVNEYDLYIRAFGSSNTRQAYVQTNDDNVDREIQTEEVDARQKWTQHPPEDFKGYGRGDGEKDIDDEEEFQSKKDRDQDLGRLNKFLEKAGQVIAILLEEGKEDEQGSRGRSQTHINVSEGYTQLDLLPILQGRHVIYSHFSPVQPSLLATVYSPAAEVTDENPVSKRGVICVWNTNEPNYPQKILVCSSQPRCCCFSPVKPSLVFAGMVDGSIAMWDLREPSSVHHPTVVNEEAYSLRYPTYDTAGVLSEENHHSPVSTILPIYSYVDNSSKSDSQVQSQASEDTSSGMSFQLVSTEESAVLHFWVVAEISSPDMAGSENDFGLLPGGGVKLLKSSSITMENPSKDSGLKSGLRALDMSLMPTDPNNFYVSTDSGYVLHGIRFGKRVFPRTHSPVIESIGDVVSIDFSPFGQPCFLTGCSDGVFALYNTKSANPLISWPSITNGRAVQCVRWSRSRACVFYVLDTNSTLYVFDLLEGDVQPKQVESLSKERISSFSLTTDQRADGLGSGKEPQMLFSTESGQTEIHTIAKSLRDPEELETDYLASYLTRF